MKQYRFEGNQKWEKIKIKLHVWLRFIGQMVSVYLPSHADFTYSSFIYLVRLLCGDGATIWQRVLRYLYALYVLFRKFILRFSTKNQLTKPSNNRTEFLCFAFIITVTTTKSKREFYWRSLSKIESIIKFGLVERNIKRLWLAFRCEYYFHRISLFFFFI